MLTKIHSNLNNREEWEIKKPATISLDPVFSQKFKYLAAGGQAYVFESEDGNYVIKFFKHHLRRLPFFVKHLPLPKNFAKKRDQQRQKRNKKLDRDFSSYKLAFEELSKETEILYVHLNKTGNLHQLAHIIDKIGIEHVVDLDKVEFLLQRRATLAFPYIQNLIHKREMAEAKKAIESICNLIIERSKKGIYDEDAKIHRNFGFIDGKAILIDAGRLKRDEKRRDPKIRHADLEKITRKLGIFLEALSTELKDHLEKYIENSI